MMHLLSEDVRRDPFPLYELLRQASPVFEEPSTGMWLLLDHESVKRALTDHETFSSSVTPPTGKAPDWMIFSDSPRHASLRGIVLRAFTPSTVAALEPRVRELSRELLAPHLPRGTLELVEDYSDPLPTIVIADLIGIPAEDRVLLRRWSEGIMKLSYAMVGGALAEAKMREHAVVKEEIERYLVDLAARRRAEPRDDLLTRLVQAEVDGARLTDGDLVGFFQLLLLAGTETTTSTIASAVLELTAHPGQLALLRADPARIPAAIEEVVRHRSPTQFVFRETRREVTLRGRTIPAGRMVLPVIGAANRDPAVFAEPARFDVGRDPNPHVAFGHGVHFCIGAALARLEARVALEELLENLEEVERSEDGPWAPRDGLLVHGPKRLPLRFEPRRTSV